jgi:alkanesulfonate monooxygenase SsuD/methylene tetrahydromethanopterin reductase-like flavin-dependent oxidoreductase (luciferase family)
MKFGMLLPNLGPLVTGPGALDTLLTIAQKAEALGFDSLWVADHLVMPTAIHSRYPCDGGNRRVEGRAFTSSSMVVRQSR